MEKIYELKNQRASLLDEAQKALDAPQAWKRTTQKWMRSEI